MGLIAHWPLNGDLLDISGNDHTATNHGAVVDTAGKIGSCYIFNTLYAAGHANAAIATRTLTLANLGYTGATNANYSTNNVVGNITIVENETTVSINTSNGTDDTIAGATPSLAGVVTNTTQTFGGAKTFNEDVTVAATKAFNFSTNASMKYNSTTESIDFIFN